MAFFDTEADDEVMSEINMTPLVDVMLVLLIIFIITIPVINHAVPLKLPQASSKAEELRPERIQLSLDADGRITWNGESIDMAALETRLAAAAARSSETALHLAADKQTAYDHIAQAMSAASRAGIRNLAFVTAPQNR